MHDVERARETLSRLRDLYSAAGHVKQAAEVAGHTIEAGNNVLLWLGSANRDESVFDNPETFDVGREDNRHLAFGFGPHYCLGANLARLEAQVAMRVLLQRTRSFRRTDDDPLPLHPSFIFRSVTRLPVELKADV